MYLKGSGKVPFSVSIFTAFPDTDFCRFWCLIIANLGHGIYFFRSTSLFKHSMYLKGSCKVPLCGSIFTAFPDLHFADFGYGCS